MAKTSRASKTKPAKKTAATKAAPAEDAPAPKKAAKKKTSTAKTSKAAAAAPAPATAPKKASKKASAAEAAPAPKKAAKKKTAAAEAAPPPKKAAKKKAAAAEAAPAPKKAAKQKAAAADAAPAPKKAAKQKTTADAAPAPKKAAKKKTTAEPASEQLAFSMDIDVPAPTSAPASAPGKLLQPGDRIPDFSLEGDDGQTYSRQSLAGQRFVLYFYPKDDTPGCTREACDFRDNHPRFEAASVKVLGVSSDTLKSHARFRGKYGLVFPLLADPDRVVAQAFGVVGEKKLYGKTSIGIIRSTFVVGPDGVVEKTFSPVKVDGHAEAVLQATGAG